SGMEEQPRTSFDDRQIDQLGKSREEKFGLSEDQRKAIFRDGVLAEDRANREAEQTYPEPNSPTPEVNMAAFEKRDNLANKLIEKYRNQLARKNHLTKNQIDEIMNEGLEKSW